MNAKELAAALDGIEYPMTISADLRAAAKAVGLVIVYGHSDDLMEFDGAFEDELGCYNGGAVQVDTIGLIRAFEETAENGKDVLREYFRREGSGVVIEALWGAEPRYSWTFKTAIPHETFEVVEDGAPYCRGIVFALADAKP